METGLFVFCAALNKYDVRHSLTYDCQLQVPTTRPLRFQQARRTRGVAIGCDAVRSANLASSAKEFAQALESCGLGRCCASACEISRK